MKRGFIWTSVAVIAVILGIFFRFFALEKKAYWFDETFTSLRISGFTDRELVERFRQISDVVSVGDLLKFQAPQPSRTVLDTVRGLATEEPQNPPLYFIIARFWAEIAGGSIFSTRLLPALLSLLALPMLYWLCQELFASALVGWIAVAIVSLSPLHVLFAQTARPQSLWTTAILFSSVTLLRALRTQSSFAWALYALGLIVSLYTFILSGLFIAGFGLYVLALEKFRWTKSVVAYAISSTIAAISFVPWALVVYASRSNVAATTSWREHKLPLVELVRAWVMGVVRLFFDINNQSGDSISQLLPLLIVLPLLLALLGYSMYYVYRKAPRRSWLFIYFLAGSTFLPLAIFDVLNGGSRISAAHRYLIPAYIALQLSLAFLLARKLLCEKEGHRSAWRGTAFVILLLGCASCWVSSRTESWWNKDPDGINPEIARIINRSTAPLVISDGWLGHAFSLSSSLGDAVRLRIEPRCYVCDSSFVQRTFPEIQSGFDDVFYFHPGWEPVAYSDLQALLVSGYLKPMVSQHNHVVLWKVAK
jgi:uncharacterized membrane protein